VSGDAGDVGAECVEESGRPAGTSETRRLTIVEDCSNVPVDLPGSNSGTENRRSRLAARVSRYGDNKERTPSGTDADVNDTPQKRTSPNEHRENKRSRLAARVSKDGDCRERTPSGTDTDVKDTPQKRTSPDDHREVRNQVDQGVEDRKEVDKVGADDSKSDRKKSGRRKRSRSRNVNASTQTTTNSDSTERGDRPDRSRADRKHDRQVDM